MTQSTPNGIRGREGGGAAWEGSAISFCLEICVSRVERIAHAGKDVGRRVGQTTFEAHLLSVQALRGDGQEDSY